MKKRLWNALRRVPCQISEISEISNKTLRVWYLVFGMLFAGFLSNLRNLRISEQKHYVFECWCVECSSLGPSEISEISEKKHYIFEIWCLECSSLGPSARISMHLSNSVWLVCVTFCMVLCKCSCLTCTPWYFCEGWGDGFIHQRGYYYYYY